MYRLTKIFILTAFSFISTQFIYAHNVNLAPDTSAEEAFIMQSRNRFNQMNQTNRNMIQEDHRMMREGFDPNENYYDHSSNVSSTHYDRNNPYKDQEQMMRGNNNDPVNQ